jgi:hypothetical protein
MDITIKLRADAARSLRSGQASTEASELQQLTTQLGVSLRSVHPRAEDPLLASYFQIEVPDEATANKVIDALRKSSAVEGAYIKPKDELP